MEPLSEVAPGVLDIQEVCYYMGEHTCPIIKICSETNVCSTFFLQYYCLSQKMFFTLNKMTLLMRIIKEEK